MSVRANRRHIAGLKEGREPGQFCALPYVVIRSTEFALLSAAAVKLFMDLLAQFNGANNGDLSAAWALMSKREWKSRDTLGKALMDLLEAGFVIRTRQGGRRYCSLYGFTFYRIDRCDGKLDLAATRSPPGGWRKAKTNGASGNTPSVSVKPLGNTPSVSEGGQNALH
jgi:hypothetical protein